MQRQGTRADEDPMRPADGWRTDGPRVSRTAERDMLQGSADENQPWMAHESPGPHQARQHRLQAQQHLRLSRTREPSLTRLLLSRTRGARDHATWRHRVETREARVGGWRARTRASNRAWRASEQALNAPIASSGVLEQECGPALVSRTRAQRKRNQSTSDLPYSSHA